MKYAINAKSSKLEKQLAARRGPRNAKTAQIRKKAKSSSNTCVSMLRNYSIFATSIPRQRAI